MTWDLTMTRLLVKCYTKEKKNPHCCGFSQRHYKCHPSKDPNIGALSCSEWNHSNRLRHLWRFYQKRRKRQILKKILKNIGLLTKIKHFKKWQTQLKNRVESSSGNKFSYCSTIMLMVPHLYKYSRSVITTQDDEVSFLAFLMEKQPHWKGNWQLSREGEIPVKVKNVMFGGGGPIIRQRW